MQYRSASTRVATTEPVIYGITRRSSRPSGSLCSIVGGRAASVVVQTKVLGNSYDSTVTPTVFRDGPFRVHFFSLEEPRMHVHVVTSDGEAKFWMEPRLSSLGATA